MAIHEDDPCWSIFGLPRIITCEENLDRFLKLVDDKHNGIALWNSKGELLLSDRNVALVEEGIDLAVRITPKLDPGDIAQANRGAVGGRAQDNVAELFG